MNITKSKYFRWLSAFAIFAFILFLFLSWLRNAPSKIVDNLNRDVPPLFEVHDQLVDEQSGILLNLIAIPPDVKEGQDFPSLTPYGFAIHEDAYNARADTFCITSLLVGEAILLPVLEQALPLCAPYPDKQGFMGQWSYLTTFSGDLHLLTFSLPRGPQPYWYPFDDFQMNLLVQLSYALKAEGKTLTEEVTFPTIGLNWNSLNSSWSLHLSSVSSEDFDFRDIGRNYLHLSFFRPMYLMAAPILLIPLVLISLALISTVIKDASTFVIAILTIFLGLNGVKETLIPTELVTRTWIDEVIPLLYLFAFAIVVARFWNYSPDEQVGGEAINLSQVAHERSKTSNSKKGVSFSDISKLAVFFIVGLSIKLWRKFRSGKS